MAKVHDVISLLLPENVHKNRCGLVVIVIM